MNREGGKLLYPNTGRKNDVKRQSPLGKQHTSSWQWPELWVPATTGAWRLDREQEVWPSSLTNYWPTTKGTTLMSPQTKAPHTNRTGWWRFPSATTGDARIRQPLVSRTENTAPLLRCPCQESTACVCTWGSTGRARLKGLPRKCAVHCVWGCERWGKGTELLRMRKDRVFLQRILSQKEKKALSGADGEVWRSLRIGW